MQLKDFENMHLLFAKIHKSWYVTIILMASAIVWGIGQLHHDKQVNSLVPLVDPSLDCQTDSQGNNRTFVIYSGGESSSTLLNSIVCDNSIINKQFGMVSSYWGVSDVNTISMLGNGKADLALVKENIMSALKAEDTHGYKKIAFYPNYKTYLISLDEKPVLSKEYFLDKKIGLVVYPTSRSGHIVPKKLFTQLGLTFSRMNIVYASTHGELRELLIAGKVDIISSYWQAEDEIQFSENYITSIADSVSGTAWYLRLARQNDDLLCAAQQFLTEFAAQQQSSYYQKLKLTEQNCRVSHNLSTTNFKNTEQMPAQSSVKKSAQNKREISL